ncbi:unnamed protein product [Haemonchus placei]|uniref:Uncharacterized protein n=1 Tax=Haemonchus placei TaxID=6290 RepID=A0A3P7T8Y8_HAEPC|nr:unnamed protein product [Haemonchus placei]
MTSDILQSCHADLDLFPCWGRNPVSAHGVSISDGGGSGTTNGDTPGFPGCTGCQSCTTSCLSLSTENTSIASRT